MDRTDSERGAADRWTPADLPDQSGRIAVVTGGSAGLGRAAATMLARRGATVVLACRNRERAERVAELMGDACAGASVRIVRLDLASLASVREAAAEIRSTCPHLDLLINNAGVMGVPYQRTEDGFELTLATNHLGHFALTGLLLDHLLATTGSRIVTVSSLAHRRGLLNLDDPHAERKHDPEAAYARSKLANLLFTYELDRRLRATGARTMALAAHPGNARTELWRTSSQLERMLISPRLRPFNSWLVHSVEAAAMPMLRAAADPSARGGEYYGPAGRFQYTGRAVRVASSARSHDAAAQRGLWDISEQLTRVSYRLSGPPYADGHAGTG